MGLSNQSFPIICIGQMKAGTTWLYELFGHFADMWRAPVKEIHFLDVFENVGRTTVHERMSYDRNCHHKTLLDLNAAVWRPELDAFVEQFNSLKARPLSESTVRELKWWNFFLLGDRDWTWYERLFLWAHPKKFADITPAYDVCSDEVIDQLVQKMPGVRVIFLLRNPLSRIVSHLSWSQHWNVPEGKMLSDWECFQNILQSSVDNNNLLKVVLGHSRAGANLEKWASRVPAGQIFVGFLDDIVNHQHQLISAVAGFLESNCILPPDNPLPPVNVGKTVQIDARVINWFIDWSEQEANALARFLGALPEWWAQDIAQMRGVLGTGTFEWKYKGYAPPSVPFSSGVLSQLRGGDYGGRKAVADRGYETERVKVEGSQPRMSIRIDDISGTNKSSSLNWVDRPNRNMMCRACGIEGNMPHVVTASQAHLLFEDVSFYRCDNCRSLNAFADRFTDFRDDNLPAYAWTHYLHLGAGIDTIGRLLDRAGSRNGTSLLDIGCGFGFALDYWKEVVGGEAVGLEASEYGRLGRRLLNATIYPKYLNEADEIKGRRFERVISSEVIEHVDDTESFLSETRAHLAKDGILILTTPNAAFVEDGQPLSVLMATLSPGLHKVLFTEDALAELLRRSGFAFYDIKVEGERLVAYASDIPLALNVEPRAERKRYIAYLKKKVSVSGDDALGLGFSFRAFKELINDGCFGEALRCGMKIVTGVKHIYRFDPTELESCRRAVLGCASLDDYERSAPFFLPCFVFYAAMAVRHGHPIKGMNATAAEAFSCAAELCEDAQRVAPLFSQEAASLYWPAVFEEASARLHAGDREGALALFERVKCGSAADRPYLAYAARSEHLLLRAMVQSGVAILQMGEPEKALGIFRHVLCDSMAQRTDDIYREAMNLWHVAKSHAESFVPSPVTSQ